MVKKQYFCTVFFMVLDLRLNEKIGLSGDNLLFFYIITTYLISIVKQKKTAAEATVLLHAWSY